MKTIIAIVGVLFFISACSKDASNPVEIVATPIPNPEFIASPAPSLSEILASQSEENKARFDARHPLETLTFFDVQPGMTVLEALPGGGWYSKILIPLLGTEGKLIGVDYAFDMWPHFNFVDEVFLAERKTWSQDWIKDASSWQAKGAQITAYTFATLPEELNSTVDRVLFIRALHNLSRFENKGQYLSKALSQSYTVLKPGGLVGVVQHAAPDERSDEWADGSRGYLKKTLLIKQFEAAGFEWAGEIDVNANPNDVPGENDIVWRLPPSYANTKEVETLKAQVDAIGESNRMTLLFKKPEV